MVRALIYLFSALIANAASDFTPSPLWDLVLRTMAAEREYQWLDAAALRELARVELDRSGDPGSVAMVSGLYSDAALTERARAVIELALSRRAAPEGSRQDRAVLL